MIVVCEQGVIADPLLKTECKHKNISRDSHGANQDTGTSRINVEHLIKTAVSNKYTLPKVVSKFFRLRYHLCDFSYKITN
jgi:hypothetical protein